MPDVVSPNPLLQAVTTHAQLVKDELNQISKRHMTTTWGMMGVVVVLMFVMGFFMNRALTGYNQQLAAAEVKYQEFEKTLKADQAQIATDQAAIAQLSTQQQVVVKVVHDRNQQTDQQIQQVIAPNRSYDQVANDVLGNHVVPSNTFTKEADGTMGVTLPDMQFIVGTKIDRDRLLANLASETTLYSDEQNKNALLTKDFSKSQADLNQANVDLKQYRKVAHKSKFRKVLDVAEKVGFVAAGIWLGRTL